VIGSIRAGADVEKDVRGLHVAMHETTRMRRVEGARDLCENADRARRFEATFLQAAFEIAPLHVAHRDEEAAFGRSRLVDRNDVRVVDRCSELRLAQEAVAERRVVGEPGCQHLERNPSLETQVLGEVDDAHASPAQQRVDPVPGELRADTRAVAHVHVRILTCRIPGTIRRLDALVGTRCYSCVSAAEVTSARRETGSELSEGD
jgi:hypothetical protein